jgi:hypothetical protein
VNVVEHEPACRLTLNPTGPTYDARPGEAGGDTPTTPVMVTLSPTFTGATADIVVYFTATPDYSAARPTTDRENRPSAWIS